MKISNLSFYLKFENLLLILLPFSLVLGNLVLNLNIILIILLFFYNNFKSFHFFRYFKQLNYFLIFLITFLGLNAFFFRKFIYYNKRTIGIN